MLGGGVLGGGELGGGVLGGGVLGGGVLGGGVLGGGVLGGDVLGGDALGGGVLGGGVLGGGVLGGGVLGGSESGGGVPGGGVPGEGMLGGGVLGGGVLGGSESGGGVPGEGVLGGRCDNILVSESWSLSETHLVLRNSSSTPRGAAPDRGRYSLVKEADRLISTCWGFLGTATPPSFLERPGVQRWVRAVGSGGSCLPEPLPLAASIASSCGWMCRLRRSWEAQRGCLLPSMLLSPSWDPPE